MTEPPIPLTALSKAQRAQATQHFTIIPSALEDGVTQTQVASTHHISVSTIRRWVKRYREKGLAGLADAKMRSDKGKSRRLPAEAVTLIEGLALQTPPRSIAAIHRQVCTLAGETCESGFHHFSHILHRSRARFLYGVSNCLLDLLL